MGLWFHMKSLQGLPSKIASCSSKALPISSGCGLLGTDRRDVSFLLKVQPSYPHL